MSTVAEIEAALSRLSTERLPRVEQALHQEYHQRRGSLIYDNCGRVLLDADRIACAEEAFPAYDTKEATERLYATEG